MSSILTKVQVVLETDSVLVVNKPPGLIVHGDGRTDEPNLCDWILDEYPDTAGVGEAITREGQPDIARPGIVHRLDRETSGVLVVARTQEAYQHIKEQFKNREVEKTYDAFVYGSIDQRHFTADKPIGRSSGDDFRRMAVAPYVRGQARDAQTDFVLQATISDASWLRALPRTGRTHQIRVHLKSLHHPIVCDSLYASGKQCLWDLDRQALHARSISVTLPSGGRIAAEADLPDDLQKAKQAFHS